MLDNLVGIVYIVDMKMRKKVYCPHCKTTKPMVKAGYCWTATGKRQRWECTNKPCRKTTVKPRSEPNVKAKKN